MVYKKTSPNTYLQSYWNQVNECIAHYYMHMDEIAFACKPCPQTHPHPYSQGSKASTSSATSKDKRFGNAQFNISISYKMHQFEFECNIRTVRWRCFNWVNPTKGVVRLCGLHGKRSALLLYIQCVLRIILNWPQNKCLNCPPRRCLFQSDGNTFCGATTILFSIT